MSARKTSTILLAALFALCAISAANASAAQFTYSATGEIEGVGKQTQVFTTNGGTVNCPAAQTTVTGKINATASNEQEVTVHYTGCNGFSITTDISDAKYLFTADGTVHLTNTVTITATAGIFHCTITVGPQTLTGITYESISTNTMKVTPHVHSIAYTASGGFCGSSGTNGTYTGDVHVSRKGGGSIGIDTP